MSWAVCLLSWHGFLQSKAWEARRVQLQPCLGTLRRWQELALRWRVLDASCCIQIVIVAAGCFVPTTSKCTHAKR